MKTTTDRAWYSIKLLDKQGYTITEEEDVNARHGCRANLKECKERARYLLSEDHAKSCEPTQAEGETAAQAMGFDRVEIWLDGDCVWDESI